MNDSVHGVFFSVCVFLLGLPLDITPDEFVEIMSKCGIIMRDPVTEEYKIKLYKDKDGNQKGDGLCCYLKVGCYNTMVMYMQIYSIYISNKTHTCNNMQLF